MTLSLKGLLVKTVVSAGLVVVGATSAFAASISATLTADNHYALFSGNNDGSLLNFVGRNEFGPSGSSGGYNWSHPETWNFNVNANDYLYVVAWDDARVDEAWLGQFNIAGETVLTGSDDWSFITGGTNPGDYGNVPGNAELQSFISTGNWIGTISRGNNGMQPWGTIAGISTDAQWLNTTTPSNGHYTIFRTKAPAEDLANVPEPSSLLGLLVIGALGTGSVLKRQHKM